MQVTNGSINHTVPISNLLVDHYHRLNSRFGYNRYKTNLERISEIVSERLSDKHSIYKYIVLEDSEGEFAGFVNMMFTKDISEILMLEMPPNYNTYENASLLFNAAMNEFKRQNVKQILTEISPEEPHYKRLFEEINGEVLLWTATVKL